MSDEAALDELLSLWQAEKARGRDLPADVICCDRPELAEELGRRIDAVRRLDDLAGQEAETPAPPALPSTGATLLAGPRAAPAEDGLRIPGYEILEELGRGGMGVVYKARQVKAGRLVALKMILAARHVSLADQVRFQIEAEAVARLQHPHVVQLHEVGEVEGRPFFSLEFCAGGGLDRRLKAGAPPPREAAALVEKLARAVHAAHLRGIVHRDLKPANVLLTAEGEPKVSDFGLAKRLDADSELSLSGQLMGTPHYMAPEQAAGRARDVGPAADVYALGAILYECLTGQPPFTAGSLSELLERARTADPVPPRRLRATVPRDLETICLKCLQKEPAKRYASAEALADDLRRFRVGEPISARPVGAVKRAAKWCKRRPAVASLLATLAVVTALGVAGVLWKYFDAEEQRSRAEERKTAAEAAEARAEERREAAEKAEKRANQERDEKGRELTRAEGLLYASQLARAQLHWQEGNAAAARDLLDSCRWDYRGWEYFHLRQQFDETGMTLRGHTDYVTCVCFSPDGRLLSSGGMDTKVKVWDAATGRELRTLKGYASEVAGVCFSPDGKRLAAGNTSYMKQGGIKVWDLGTGKELLAIRVHPKEVTGICFSPDGKRLAGGARDFGKKEGEVKVWDAATGQELFALKGHANFVTAVSFSADGKRLASASQDQTVKVWDVVTRRELLTLKGHKEAVTSVSFCADGKRLATGSGDKTVKVWDVATGQELFTGRHKERVRSVSFCADGKRLASGGEDKVVQVWDTIAGRQLIALTGSTNFVRCVCFSADGSRLASAGGYSVTVWDGARGQEPLTLAGHDYKVNSVSFSPDGRRLASGSNDRKVKVWDAATGQELFTLQGHLDGVLSVCFSPDGRRLASASGDKKVKVWDAVAGRELFTLEGHKSPILCVCFSPDGRRLASASSDKAVKVWDAATRKEERTLTGHTGMVWGVCFSPDGRRLASASEDKTVKVWDVATGQEARTLQRHTEWVTAVAFSPDGTRLASASYDRTVRVWDAATGQELFSLRGHTDPVTSISFSPDGRRLASGGGDPGMNKAAEVKVWDLTRGQDVLTGVIHMVR
jgi:WD40 repeat protein/tRNA A-37 threonylcarbamoyl transferase component Bud32